MEKYRVSTYRYQPITVEDCLRETAAYLTLSPGDIVKKVSTMDCYFDTWDEAHQWLIGRQEEIVEIARAELEEAERRLDEYRSISEHEEE